MMINRVIRPPDAVEWDAEARLLMLRTENCQLSHLHLSLFASLLPLNYTTWDDPSRIVGSRISGDAI